MDNRFYVKEAFDYKISIKKNYLKNHQNRKNNNDWKRQRKLNDKHDNNLRHLRLPNNRTEAQKLLFVEKIWKHDRHVDYIMENQCRESHDAAEDHHANEEDDGKVVWKKFSHFFGGKISRDCFAGTFLDEKMIK